MENDSEPSKPQNDAAKSTGDGNLRTPQGETGDGNKDQASQPPTQSVNEIKNMEIEAPEKVVLSAKNLPRHRREGWGREVDS
jgi:hypothetical protein